MLVGLKHSEANLLKISTSWLCLRVAQMPRSQNLMNFMLTMTTMDGQTDCLTPLHVQGQNYSPKGGI